MADNIDEAFGELYRSTNTLHTRFETRQTLREALACFDEEVREFKTEVLDAASLTYSLPLTEEAIDVIVTILGILRAYNVDDAHLAMMLRTVALNNDAKTTSTHEVNAAGKIARKRSGTIEDEVI